MKVALVVMDDFLLLILTTPLIDRSLQMDLYKLHNLPELHPDLGVQFTYVLEGQYLAISKHGLYAAVPTEYEIRFYVATEEYLCIPNQDLYPVKN